MIKLSEHCQAKYDSFMKKYFINGQFNFFNDYQNEVISNPLNGVVREYSTIQYSSVETTLELVKLAYLFLDNKTEEDTTLKKKVFDIINKMDNKSEDYLLLLIVNSVSEVFYNDLNSELTEDEEMNFMWRY